MSIIANVFKQFLGEPAEHNSQSGQMSFDCPSCAEEGKGRGKHKLAVNYKKNIFRCWVCGFEKNMHGRIPYLIKRFGNSKILKEYKLLRPDDDNGESIRPVPVKVDLNLPKGFTKLTKENSTHFKFDTAYRYVTERGITDEMIEYYNIGYTVVGKYHDRIIIPSYDEFGDLNYFVSRSWEKRAKSKYLNPDVEKKDIIFNEDKINWDSTIYLVEGAFDHIVIPNSIPLLGKALSDQLKFKLHDRANANIVIVLDDDAYEDAMNIYRDLNSARLYNKIRFCKTPEKYDPSDVFKLLGNEGIVKLLNKSYKIPEIKLF
jgi:hypothetical protein